MTDEELDTMERMWRMGCTGGYIARVLGVTPSVVQATASMHRDRFPYHGHFGERATWPCGGCFMECEPRMNHTKQYPCDLPMRQWAAAHRLDPGDELGYVWEGEK